MAWAPLKLGKLMPQRRPAPKVQAEPKPPQSFEKLTPDKATKILGSCGSVVEKSKTLIQYVDKNRLRARQLGIETIAVELSGMIESGALKSVLGSLETSVKENKVCHISQASLDKLQHAEAIVSDATRQMDKQLSQANEGVGYIWVPFAVIGAAAVGVAVLASKPKKPIVIQVPGMKNGRKKPSEIGKVDGHKKPADEKEPEEEEKPTADETPTEEEKKTDKKKVAEGKKKADKE